MLRERERESSSGGVWFTANQPLQTQLVLLTFHSSLRLPGPSAKSTVKLPPPGVLSVRASVAFGGRKMKLSKAKKKKRRGKGFSSVSDVPLRQMLKFLLNCDRSRLGMADELILTCEDVSLVRRPLSARLCRCRPVTPSCVSRLHGGAAL